LVLAVLVAPRVTLVARKRAAVFARARRAGLSDVGGLIAVALAGFLWLRCHYQEVHTADHGYPVTRLAKWKGLRGHRASALVRGLRWRDFVRGEGNKGCAN
jgi:prolipoprotein diacylglyceryltransferase